MTFVLKRSAAAAEAVRQIQTLVRDGELEPGERLPPERVVDALRRRSGDEAAAAMDAHIAGVERSLGRWRRGS